MESQKHLFQLPKDIHYLNCAYMSPLLASVEEAGIIGMRRKRNPALLKPADFFAEAEEVKTKFGKIVGCPTRQVAIIPSASYGLKSAVNNIPLETGNQAIVVSDEFPSGFYTIFEWCRKNGKELTVIKAPNSTVNRGETWTEMILSAISDDTSAVVMSSIHWTDGTKFDLKKIGEKCKEVNSLLIVDGTQSVGALPIDVVDFKIDALICAGYKWLLGPYSIGMAYYSEFFDNGTPIEDSWLNKSNAEDFTRLTAYDDSYREGAARYNVGEYSNFILLSMINKSLEQILEWQVNSIQNYCRELIQPLLKFLRENGFWVEADDYRANHLFGFLLPKTINRDSLLQKLEEKKVFVSVRGDAIRVSQHLYNTAEDIEALINVLKGVLSE